MKYKTTLHCYSVVEERSIEAPRWKREQLLKLYKMEFTPLNIFRKIRARNKRKT